MVPSALGCFGNGFPDNANILALVNRRGILLLLSRLPMGNRRRRIYSVCRPG
jgi:hypothetical protein